MIKNKIWKRFKKKIILLLILTTIGITFFQIDNYNTVRAGGRVWGMRMEKFWNGNRFYVILERDNGHGIREYQISEKDYYRLGEEYIIIFMDGHIETLEEFKEMKESRKSIEYIGLTKIHKQIDKIPEYVKRIIYFIGMVFTIIVAVVILKRIYIWRKYK